MENQMNDILKKNPFLITVQEQMPGRFMAHSLLDAETTARILFDLALNFVRKSAIEKHEAMKAKQGSILNPHTGQTMPKGN